MRDFDACASIKSNIYEAEFENNDSSRSPNAEFINDEERNNHYPLYVKQYPLHITDDLDKEIDIVLQIEIGECGVDFSASIELWFDGTYDGTFAIYRVIYADPVVVDLSFKVYPDIKTSRQHTTTSPRTAWARWELGARVDANVTGTLAANTDLVIKRVQQLDGTNNAKITIYGTYTDEDDALKASTVYMVPLKVTNGYYKTRKHEVKLPVTEVVPKTDFFDYDAKYNGKVEEITPARIPDELRDRIQDLTAKIYDLLGCHGIIRNDYIITDGDKINLLEVNTTPGMTATSFIPQQIRAAGLNLTDVLTEIIEDSF